MSNVEYRRSFSVGERIEMPINRSRLHVFEVAGGANIGVPDASTMVAR
jgi:hypothetical protein